jgi:hypothetical protein
MALKDELQDIISGNGKVRHGANIQAITSFLRRKKTAISVAEAPGGAKQSEAAVHRLTLLRLTPTQRPGPSNGFTWSR